MSAAQRRKDRPLHISSIIMGDNTCKVMDTWNVIMYISRGGNVMPIIFVPIFFFLIQPWFCKKVMLLLSSCKMLENSNNYWSCGQLQPSTKALCCSSSQKISPLCSVWVFKVTFLCLVVPGWLFFFVFTKLTKYIFLLTKLTKYFFVFLFKYPSISF